MPLTITENFTDDILRGDRSTEDFLPWYRCLCRGCDPNDHRVAGRGIGCLGYRSDLIGALWNCFRDWRLHMAMFCSQMSEVSDEDPMERSRSWVDELHSRCVVFAEVRRLWLPTEVNDQLVFGRR